MQISDTSKSNSKTTKGRGREPLPHNQRKHDVQN